MTGTPPIVMGITGASGAPYAVRLLEQLVAAHRPVSLIVSKYGLRLLETETGIESLDALRKAVGKDSWDSCVETFSNDDRGAPPASGSALTAGMIVCPCSMGTLSAISVGASR
jgi:4-hydroxy-3-polyprenylbenzoate decarboxylase